MGEDKKNSRQLQAEQTKARLFSTALDLLRETDFDSIRIQDIVARAGVSVGTFYVYYQSKLDVFYQTYAIADQYFENEVAPKLTQPTAVAQLQYFFAEYARYNSEITEFKLTKLLYNSGNKCFNRDFNSGMLNILQGIVEQGLQRGELVSRQTAKVLSNYLMIAVRGLVYNWCTLDGSFDLMEATADFVTQLLHGCLPK